MSNATTFFHNHKVEFKAAITDLDQLHQWLAEASAYSGVAMVGRSNVGKSSLINALFGKKTAKVSNTPGRTQSINIFHFYPIDDERPVILYDLPGYGHAEVSKQMRKKWNMLLGHFFEYVSDNTILLNIQDARHPFQKSDQSFLSWLNDFPQRLCYLCLNKYDKLKKQKERAALEKSLKQSLKLMRSFKLIYKVSAETKMGLEQLHDALMEHFLLCEQKRKSLLENL